ncbi:MAG: class I tRNA ligase family protein, partial [Spirochaetales bacterium]
RTLKPFSSLEQKPVDKWVFHRLNETVRGVESAMASYRFNEAAQLSYEFFWNDFCDWYIEASKLSLYSENEAEKDRATTLLVRLLEESLRMLHPFMSFVTEEIYQKLPAIPETERSEALITAAYPKAETGREAPHEASAFASLQELVRLVRTLRSEFTIPPPRKIRFVVECEPGFQHTSFFAEHRELIEMLTTSEQTSYGTSRPDASGSVTLVGNGFQAFAFVRDAINVEDELAKLKKNLEKTEKLLVQSEKKLANQGFLANAGEEVIAKENAKRDEFAGIVAKLKSYLSQLDA